MDLKPVDSNKPTNEECLCSADLTSVLSLLLTLPYLTLCALMLTVISPAGKVLKMAKRDATVEPHGAMRHWHLITKVEPHGSSVVPHGATTSPT